MTNPFMDLSPAEIDVLDDMLEEWRCGSKYHRAKYGPKKAEAFERLWLLIDEAWITKVHYRDVEEMDD